MQVVKADTEELLQAAFTLRKEVFVVEQGVPSEDEFDQYEEVSSHFVVLDERKEAVGAARWRPTDGGIKLERFAVKKSARGKGLGSMLLDYVLSDIRSQEGSGKYLYLHAQVAAVALYARSGFEKIGDQFAECGIWHYKMHCQS